MLGAVASALGVLRSSPTARGVALAAVAVAVVVWARHDAAEDARAAAEAGFKQDMAAAVAEERERQQEAVRGILRRAETRSEAAVIRERELKEQADVLAAELEAISRSAGGACRLPDDMARRLRDLR